MLGRQFYTKRSSRVAAILLSVFMIMALASPAVQAETVSRPVPKMSQIREMLEGRNYAEGDAIVVAEKGFNPASYINGDSEKLAEADEEALSLTADAARETEFAAHEVMADRADASRASSYNISIVHSDSLSTAALISKLYLNPKVISVEPNYLIDAAEAYATDSDDSADTASDDTGDTTASNAVQPGQHDPNVGDLSSAQWYLGDGGGYNTLEGDGQAGYGMDLPGYAGGGRGNYNSSPASTIAILDSGMDVTHPDFKDQFITFTAAQQKRYNCGEHGLNATAEPGSDKVGDLRDTVDHGTHVSGIMGAAWDGKGTAGVANGAKLVGVRLSDESGMQSAEGNIRAFNFLINCAQEINLKSANCSWGSDTGTIEFTYTLLVNELGRHGVITVFAAGNSQTDMDQKIETPGFIDSPYLLTVDSMNPAGKSSGFSNYGQTQTDVFAPGSDILSTVPATVIGKNPADEDTYETYSRYHPESGQGIIKRIDFKDDSTEEGSAEGVEVYSYDPDGFPGRYPVDDVEIISSGTNDKYSLKINRDDFIDPDIYDEDIQWAPGDSVFLKVPVGDDVEPEDIKFITTRAAIDMGLSSIIGTLYGFAAKTSDGIRMVTMGYDKEGVILSAHARGSVSAWGTATANVDYMLDKDADANSIYIDDEGCIYLWFGVREERADDLLCDEVYIDDITIGGSDAHASAHIVFNGTSMAAPTVTAALGIVAKDEDPNDYFEPGDGEGQLGEQALKRSARLRAATVHNTYFDERCATGGYVRLTSFKDLPSTENAPLAPIIASCAPSDDEDREIEVKGWFFGSSGDVTVDGVKAEVQSWSKDKIVIKHPTGVGNGAHVLRIETAAGVDKAPYSSSFKDASEETALYEHDLSVPDGFAADPNGITSKFYPILTASGDYIYTLQKDGALKVIALWRYHIPSDSWEMLELPTDSALTASNGCMAATPDGIVLHANQEVGKDEFNNPVTENYLFYFDTDSKTWTREEVPVEGLVGTALFSRGRDLYFLGAGPQVTVDGKERLALLSVLRKGSSKLEVLGLVPEEWEHEAFFSDGYAADGGGYVYLLSQEPIGGTYRLSYGLIRLKLDKNEKVVDIKEFYDELEDAGIIKEGVWDSTIGMAAFECGVALVNREREGTDTLLLENGSDTFKEHERTSSFYHGNSQMAVWHKGKLYVLGFSPSEPEKMFFRATEVSINHKWDDGKVTREPSLEGPGEKTYTCTCCGLKRTEEIPFEGSEYSCVYGDGSKWTKGSGKTLRFEFERLPVDEAFERYEEILIDGEVISASNYEVEKGSLIVDLKSSYLETLSLGDHEIGAMFNDGYADAKFKIAANNLEPSDGTDGNNTSKKVKTGDDGRLAYWVILLVVSALAVVASLLKRRIRT